MPISDHNVFTKIAPDKFDFNPFALVSKEWLLITAEKDGKTNTMTASWGGFGHIWRKHAAYFFIRPSRYTKEFVDATERVSLCVLPEANRDALNYLGTVSGRDEDKIAKSGLTLLHEDGVPYFAESRAVFICRTLFAQAFLESSFRDTSVIRACYPLKDFHTMYVAEVEKVLVR
jgi:flavin reductase (DIM6/NTAB) family NADH-FMN oxidoreductase RutF